MYGLKNIDFFNIATSIASTDVYPFLLVVVCSTLDAVLLLLYRCARKQD